MNTRSPVNIGFVISGHGFGHATRAIAVMQALQQQIDCTFVILTSAPPWLFTSSLTPSPLVHAMVTDIGLVQHSALAEDIPATLEALAGLYPLPPALVAQTAALLADCAFVFCDIAPLGIAAAKQAGIPSILVENFTWDWIYQGYVERYPALGSYVDLLRPLFARADYHIQTTPVCCPGRCDLVVEPVARALQAPEKIRQRLFCKPGQRLVLITMGGLQQGGLQAINPGMLTRLCDVVFVCTGWCREDEFTGNLRFLGTDHFWYHPDLVAAADLVVGKCGYSTVAESFQGNAAYAYISRPEFRESPILEAFLDRNLLSWEITKEQLTSGSWLAQLANLPQKKADAVQARGAEQIAHFVLAHLRKDRVCRTCK